MNKVLICAPIGGHKQYSINRWFEWIANQSHPNIDVAISVNGKESTRRELLQKLQQVEITTIYGEDKRVIALDLPKSDNLSTIQRITYSREQLRRYAVEHDYDYLFYLDTDTIPLTKDALEQLLTRKEDVVSGIYFYKNSKVPVILDKSTHTNVTLRKLEQCHKHDILFKSDGFGYGCLLLSHEAFSTSPFDYTLFGENRTDDFGHGHVLINKGFTLWADARVLCEHVVDPESIKTGTPIDMVVSIKSGKHEGNHRKETTKEGDT